MNKHRTTLNVSEVLTKLIVSALVFLAAFAPGAANPVAGETVQRPFQEDGEYAGASPHTNGLSFPNAPSDLPVEAQKYAWHTFYGAVDSGNYSDEPYVIATDHAGNIYLAGYSYVNWLGDGDAQPLHPFSGSYSMVVVKLNNQGIYQWHTFYPSGGMQAAGLGFVGMAVDEDGNVYLSGYSDSAWLGDGDTDPLYPFNGGWAIAVVKLNTDGAYQWHSFYGSAGWEIGSGIALDGNGGVYLTGLGAATWNGPGGEPPRHPFSGGEDILVVKLNSNGVYQWHTFYGSGYIDDGYDIAINNQGGVYISGSSSSSWQGDNNTNPIHAHSGNRDIVIIKLDANGTYQWHTFYPTVSSFKRGITTDSNGNVYFTGYNHASWQGDGNTDPLHPFSGGIDDILVVKLNSSGVYQWHTFYGSEYYDFGHGISTDEDDNVYVCGFSEWTWQGDNDTDPLHEFSAGDIFILKLNQAGAYQWHTFQGGPAGGSDIAVSEDEDLVVLGASSDTWLGEGGAQPLHPHNQNYADDFVVLKMVKIDVQALLPLIQK
jgi:hypothetical protein